MTWSTGDRATLRFQAEPPPAPVLLEAFFKPFLAPGQLDLQRIQVYLSGHPVGEWQASRNTFETYRLEIEASSFPGKRVLYSRIPDTRLRSARCARCRSRSARSGACHDLGPPEPRLLRVITFRAKVSNVESGFCIGQADNRRFGNGLSSFRNPDRVASRQRPAERPFSWRRHDHHPNSTADHNLDHRPSPG